MHATRRKSKD